MKRRGRGAVDQILRGDGQITVVKWFLHPLQKEYYPQGSVGDGKNKTNSISMSVGLVLLKNTTKIWEELIC